MNYYKILGVEPNATNREITAAFKVKALQFNPDRVFAKRNEREEEFQKRKTTIESKLNKINAAYQILGDPVKKRQYDLEMLTAKSQSSSVNQSHKNSSTISGEAKSKASSSQPDLALDKGKFKRSGSYLEEHFKKSSKYTKSTRSDFDKTRENFSGKSGVNSKVDSNFEGNSKVSLEDEIKEQEFFNQFKNQKPQSYSPSSVLSSTDLNDSTSVLDSTDLSYSRSDSNLVSPESSNGFNPEVPFLDDDIVKNLWAEKKPDSPAQKFVKQLFERGFDPGTIIQSSWDLIDHIKNGEVKKAEEKIALFQTLQVDCSYLFDDIVKDSLRAQKPIFEIIKILGESGLFTKNSLLLNNEIFVGAILNPECSFKIIEYLNGKLDPALSPSQLNSNGGVLSQIIESLDLREDKSGIKLIELLLKKGCEAEVEVKIKNEEKRAEIKKILQEHKKASVPESSVRAFSHYSMNSKDTNPYKSK